MRHVALISAIFTASVGTASAGYTFTPVIDPLNPAFSQALGVNDAGTVVGYGNAAAFNGFVLTPPATFARQNFPGSTATQVVGINNAGATVGFYIDAAGVTHGYQQSGGTFMSVDAPGTVFNQLLGINNTGLSVGYASSVDPAGATGQTAMSVSGGTLFTFLGGLPANVNSQATGVNAAGTIVGFYQPTATSFTGFVDASGAITSLMYPGSIATQALGINDLGQIVGDWTDVGGVMHGFIDTGGLFTTLDPAGSTATTINGINNHGEVVGFYTDGTGNTLGVIGTTVPEPAAVLVFGVGMAALAAGLRRRHA